MIERGEDLRFSPEACDALGIVDEAVGQDLNRDLARELRVARTIYLAL